MSDRKPKELQSVEDFERLLEEEISVSEEFDLPISVLTLVLEGGWDAGSTRRVLDSVRTADLVTRPEPAEIAIALPNTVPEDARVVEQRLRKAVPEAGMSLAERGKDDTPAGLLERARRAGNS